MSVVLEQRPSSLPPGLNRSTVYAHQRPAVNDESAPRRSCKQSTQPRALSAEERAQVIKVLRSKPYSDQPPDEVYRRLLEQGQHLCSVSTMHRILRRLSENGERRNQRPAQHNTAPRLLVQAANEV